MLEKYDSMRQKIFWHFFNHPFFVGCALLTDEDEREIMSVIEVFGE